MARWQRRQDPKARLSHLPVVQTFNADRTVVLDGDVQGCNRQDVFRSQTFETKGLSHIECFVQLNILGDTGVPTDPMVIFGALVEEGGAAGTDGEYEAVGAGLPPAGKDFQGPGYYSLSALRAGQPGTNRHSLSSLVHFELWARGQPAGRRIDMDIDGVIVAGGVT